MDVNEQICGLRRVEETPPSLREKKAEAIWREVIREEDQLFRVIIQDRRKSGRLDLEAVEMAVRPALHHAGAAALTELLQFPAPGAELQSVPCSCGHRACYQELRTKPVLTALGPAKVSRPYYLCTRCHNDGAEWIWNPTVRQHLEDHPPHADVLGAVLSQAQELDADGYGIYHDLPHFFSGAGRPLASRLLNTSSSNSKSLDNSILSCVLLAGMIQFCARGAGKIQIESDLSTEHPPLPLRINYMKLFVEMWCREVGGLPTTWMTDGTLRNYFSADAGLFQPEMKTAWDQQVAWLKSPNGENYCAEIRKGIDRLRTAKIEP